MAKIRLTYISPKNKRVYQNFIIKIQRLHNKNSKFTNKQIQKKTIHDGWIISLNRIRLIRKQKIIKFIYILEGAIEIFERVSPFRVLFFDTIFEQHKSLSKGKKKFNKLKQIWQIAINRTLMTTEDIRIKVQLVLSKVLPLRKEKIIVFWEVDN